MKRKHVPDMMVHTCNLNSQEGRWEDHGQNLSPGQKHEILSEKQNKKALGAGLNW
jgi:hypothetical protein